MTSAAAERLRSAGPAALASWLTVSALSVLVLLDMVSFGVTSAERIGYVAFVALVAFGTLASARESLLDRRNWQLLCMWLLVTALFLMPTALQHDLYPAYVAADSLSIALPALLLVIMLGNEREARVRELRVLGVAALVAALLAPIFGAAGARFEPPPTFLVTVVWSGVLLARNALIRAILLIVAVLLLYLSLRSGQRTALVIWLVIAGYVTWCALSAARWRALTAVALLVVGAVIADRAPDNFAIGLLSDYRVAAVAEGDEDASLAVRVQEAQDVVRTIREDGTPINWIVGFGHGASYRTHQSFVARNVTGEGRVHHVHISALMLFFRYGAAGLFAYLCLWVSVLATLAQLAVQPHRDAVKLVFAMGVAGYLVESLLFNVLVDPLFSYCLAGYLSTVWLERSPTQSTRAAIGVIPGGIAK